MRGLWIKLATNLYDAARWCEEQAVRLPGWRLFNNDWARRIAAQNSSPAVIDLSVIPKDKTLREPLIRGAMRRRSIPDYKDGPWNGLQGNAGNKPCDGEDEGITDG